MWKETFIQLIQPSKIVGFDPGWASCQNTKDFTSTDDDDVHAWPTKCWHCLEGAVDTCLQVIKND